MVNLPLACIYFVSMGELCLCTTRGPSCTCHLCLHRNRLAHLQLSSLADPTHCSAPEPTSVLRFLHTVSFSLSLRALHTLDRASEKGLGFLLSTHTEPTSTSTAIR